MSHELFYTSAPRGLKPGSQGYCTVAMTEGMPASLVDRLEAMSAYRPAYPAHDGRASLNPAVLSHCRLGINGRSLHVLSHVTAAGLDYTLRHNKFAHHVVLEGDDLPLGGPAWLLQQRDFLATGWDGEVKVLPSGRTPPLGDTVPGVCRHWEQVTGDAGWAGVLAGAFLDDPARPTFLVFEPGAEVLPLVAEAISLLPADRRWEVTFSTYFTGLPQGVRCAWRCVLADSAEATEAVRLPNALLLNLTSPLGRAKDDELVLQARTGKMVAAARKRPALAHRPAGVSPPPRRTVVAPAAGAREVPIPDSSRDFSAHANSPPPRKPVPPPLPALPPRPAKSALAPRARLFLGLLIGLLFALPLAGAAFAVGRFLLPRHTVELSPGDPQKFEGDGDRLLNGLRVRDAQVKTAQTPLPILAAEAVTSFATPNLASGITQVAAVLRFQDALAPEGPLGLESATFAEEMRVAGFPHLAAVLKLQALERASGADILKGLETELDRTRKELKGKEDELKKSAKEKEDELKKPAKERAHFRTLALSILDLRKRLLEWAAPQDPSSAPALSPEELRKRANKVDALAAKLSDPVADLDKLGTEIESLKKEFQDFDADDRMTHAQEMVTLYKKLRKENKKPDEVKKAKKKVEDLLHEIIKEYPGTKQQFSAQMMLDNLDKN